MATYTTTAGDTFDRVSRRTTGSEAQAAQIRAMNPDISEPIPAGISLTVPDKAPDVQRGADDSGVALTVAGSRFRYWSRVEIVRNLDGIDTATVRAPFDPGNANMRQAFKPFSYNSVSVAVGGAALFSGTLVAPVPAYGSTSGTVTAECYSRPGVLADCTPSAASLPLAFVDADLQAIASEICKPFGLSVRFDNPPGEIFTEAACRAGEKVLQFLVRLAQQRGLLVASDETGALKFFKPTAGQPVAQLEPVGVSATFRGQSYYSHVTGIEPAIAGFTGKQVSKRNPRAAGIFRPYTFEVADGSAETAVDAKLGHMLGDAVSYSVDVDGWETPAGQLWAPGMVVRLQSPRAMIYEPYNFMIRSVHLVADADTKAATLGLVLPEAYTGGTVGRMPWE